MYAKKYFIKIGESKICSDFDFFLHTFQMILRKKKTIFVENFFGNSHFLGKIKKKIVLWRLHLQVRDAFGLNPPSQLIIGYHWVVFLNQVRKNVPDHFRGE